MNQFNINSNKKYQHQISYPWYAALRRAQYHSAVFLTKIRTLDLIMRKHQINPNWDILKLTNQYSSKVQCWFKKRAKIEEKCQGHERKGTIIVWRRPRTQQLVVWDPGTKKRLLVEKLVKSNLGLRLSS